MMMAHKIALDPNDKQATYFARAAGTARFAYNWALSEWNKQYEASKTDPSKPKPTQAALRRQLNAIKRKEYPWMLEVTKNAPQMAIIQLGKAFQNYFSGRAKRPKFRIKGVDDRFTLTNDQFEIAGSHIRVPNLGWVRMREPLRFAGRILSATISRTANRWHVSVTVDAPDSGHLPQAENQGAVGVDLGVSTLATLSTGEKIPGPKPHTALLKRLRRCSRSLDRKQKGSSNRKKARRKLARLHAQIVNIRSDAMHKLTTALTRRYSVIGIEDLNVKGMLGNHRLARSIADMSFYEFRQQLAYKAAMRGGIVVVADRWYASSKTCSDCGEKVSVLPLSVREWTCPVCEEKHDRDINAAINLKKMAVSSTVSVCGGEGAGPGCMIGTKPASAKQKVNINVAPTAVGSI